MYQVNKIKAQITILFVDEVKVRGFDLFLFLFDKERAVMKNNMNSAQGYGVQCAGFFLFLPSWSNVTR